MTNNELHVLHPGETVINQFDQEYLRCKKVWETQGATWQNRFEHEINLHRFVKSKLPAYSHVLDVGCCDGVFDYNLALEVFNVTGLDASKEAIEVAKKQKTTIAWSKNNPQFIHNRFEKFNSNHIFHYVLMLEFLEHQDDFEIAAFMLRKAYNICTKGVIISVPINHLVPDNDHKIIFSAELFFNLVNKSTFQTNEPPPIIEYFLINKLNQDKHNRTFTPNLFVAIIKKIWIKDELES